MTSKRFAILSLIATFFLLQSCTMTVNRPISLEATIEGLENDSILIECFPIISSEKETDIKPHHCYAVSKNNKFIYVSPFETPSYVYISPNKATYKKKDGRVIAPIYIIALLEPGKKLTLTGSIKPYSIEYNVTGSEFNEELSKLRASYSDLSAEALKIELLIDSVYHANKKKRTKELIELSKKRHLLVKGIENTKLNFIKNNLNKDIAAHLLSHQRIDTFGKYYPQLSKNVRNGILKTSLDEQYIYYQKDQKLRKNATIVVKGAYAPDFTLKDIEGNLKSLKDFNKKIVVLDFWGSWCSWCIKGYPKMKSYYKKYKDRLEIIGIACRDNEEDWKKAVEENELNWVNLFNNYESELTINYGVIGYPTKIIIDKDQKIIERFMGETPKFYKKLDELLGK